MIKLEHLLLTIYKFDSDFEVVERGYLTNVKSKKDVIVNLFDKIRKQSQQNIDIVA